MTAARLCQHSARGFSALGSKSFGKKRLSFSVDMPIAGAQGSYIAPWKQQFEDKHGGSFELDDSNFAHMAEYDPEDPAQAAKDYEEYLAGRKPIDALLERLQVGRPQLRTAVRLNWADKKLTDRDCEVLAELFKGHTTFTVNPSVANIGLDNNKIGDAGLIAIVGSMMIPNSMFTRCTHMWLNNNRFGGEGVTALAECMAKGRLPKLHKLYLHDNQIDDEGARALAKTIAFCHEEVACLRFLYLANNRITKAGKAAIAEAVAKRNRITVFYEDSRPVSPGPA